MKQITKSGNPISFVAFIFCSILIAILIFWAFPKFKHSNAEATIGWDVTGYYYYLPAVFIYKDLKHLNFKDSITQKYHPTPQFGEAFQVENGNYVFKYSSGLAIQLLPGFLIGHLITKYFTDYPSDGFSRPYQLSIALNSFLICFIGLWYLRKILLKYFSDRIVAITLLTLVLVTNYLNYTAFDGAMTHNYVFTLYALLIFITIKFYEKPNYLKASCIGLIIGLAALTRPTEIISSLIPILWGVNISSKKSIIERFHFIKQHFLKYILAIFLCICLGSIQLIYWKYTSGHWIVYSYQEQGFSWLKPHLFNGLFSYKCGWLIYTPIMFFALIGIYLLKTNESTKKLTSLIFIFTVLFIYVAFAWDIWWYGGSLGQRTMVQSYALLSIPLGVFFKTTLNKRWLKIIVIPLWLLFLYLNIWWTYQAHFGRYFYTEQINKAYFWNVLGKLTYDENDLKMLDTNEKNVNNFYKKKMLYENNFENDSLILINQEVINGLKSLKIGKELNYNPEFCFGQENNNYNYLRSQALFRCINKEWEYWRSMQFGIRFKYNSEVVKEKIIRVDRFFDNGKESVLFFDTKVPNKPFNKICLFFWNSEGNGKYIVDNLSVEALISQ